MLFRSILGDRKLEDIHNPRLAKMKEKTLRWHFDTIHVCGKMHVGPDTLSRKEVANVIAALSPGEEEANCLAEMSCLLEARIEAGGY